MMKETDIDWKMCLEISDADQVDEAIHNLIADRTEDNAVCMVRSVITEFSNRVPAVMAYPEQVDDDLRYILSTMLWTSGRMCQVFRLDGVEIPTKAEEEQVFVIHWMLKHYLKHGKQWRRKAVEEMDAMQARVKAKEVKP